MSNSLCTFNWNDLNVETCILELIKIALKRKASSIAIRFNPKKHKIQVVDNGIGFTKYELSCFFSNDRNLGKVTIFDKIIFVSNAIIITSRSKFSLHTYVKVASVNKISKVFKGYHRPSKGTTVTIYGFDFSKWNNLIGTNYSISYVIVAIAFVELKVSFLLRNDDQQKIILNINQFHSPWEVLKYLISNKTDELSSYSITQVLQENKKNFDIKEIECNKEVYNFSLLNISSNLFYEIDVIKNNIYTPLFKWENWSNNYKNLIENKSIDNYNKFFSSVNQIHISNQNFINLSQISVWSNWSYHPTILNINDNIKNNVRDPHYKFLPISIYKILPYKHCKILNYKSDFVSSKCSSLNIFDDNKLNIMIRKTAKCFKKMTNIRICNTKQKFDEYRISGNTINSLQILKQINKEFIAAITNESGKRILIMIDQHAAHERIRYEWLIDSYKEENNYKYLSVKLCKELWISDIHENLINIIILNKKIFIRVGINVKSTIGTSCIVDAVPKCFIKKIKNFNDEYNLYKLKKNVRLLLLEIANGLKISKNILPPVLPVTIHNVIASEACHEAIKFGDPLNIKDCTLLIQSLQDTNGPTRCAHGRPSIVPILDLSNLEKRKVCTNKKLNFDCLKNILTN